MSLFAVWMNEPSTPLPHLCFRAPQIVPVNWLQQRSGCEIKRVEMWRSLRWLWGRGPLQGGQWCLVKHQILKQMRAKAAQTTKTIFVSVPICRDCLTNLVEVIRSLKRALISSHGNAPKLPRHRGTGPLMFRHQSRWRFVSPSEGSSSRQGPCWLF